MKERRVAERRNLASISVHTTVGRRGQDFNADQRRIPDRRLNNIAVEFISIDDFLYLANTRNDYHS